MHHGGHRDHRDHEDHEDDRSDSEASVILHTLWNSFIMMSLMLF